jgi:hypothetical protein
VDEGVLRLDGGDVGDGLSVEEGGDAGDHVLAECGVRAEDVGVAACFDVFDEEGSEVFWEALGGGLVYVRYNLR